jgi:phenylacetate-CoA ligase
MEKSDLAFYYLYPKFNSRKKQEVRTSGSTGKPIRFWCDNERIASSLALVDSRFLRLGLTKDDTFMRLWYPTTGHTKIQLLKEKFFRWYTNEKFFSYFALISGEKSMDDFIKFIQDNRPDFIEGYAGGIIATASYIIKHKIIIPPVRTIVTGAGMVRKEQHELIEQAFGCRHYDRYGCSEFGEIAHQMGAEYYEQNPFLKIHVSKDLKKFYELSDAPDGDYEIFVTDPRNWCTPFWRYRMNDMVTVNNGKIVAISGRTETMYEISPGEFLPTGFFYQAMKDFILDQWQIELDTRSRVMQVRSVPTELDDRQRIAFEKYFGKDKFKFVYSSDGFSTVGRRRKIEEIIVH